MLLLACAELPPAVAQPDPWTVEVSSRLRDDAYAFHADGADFTAEAGPEGLRARVGLGGAWIGGDEEGFALTTSAWGRIGSMEAAQLGAPALGECIALKVDPEGNCIRRVESVDGNLTEWWAVDDQGVEQGWLIAASPAGTGPLTVILAVEGAQATIGDDVVWLEGDGGDLWSVSGLEAWDADGTALHTQFERSEVGFRIAVDDTGAAYPVTIDPVYATASRTLTGAAAGDALGRGMSTTMATTMSW
ncbi:hypothetical protein LBMAG42_47450 [Deltaproteobacteria bacterium]|nr:hypothetical protein LBMAG42_47450 [Deltaproteobacteria bacterium]